MPSPSRRRKAAGSQRRPRVEAPRGRRGVSARAARAAERAAKSGPIEYVEDSAPLGKIMALVIGGLVFLGGALYLVFGSDKGRDYKPDETKKRAASVEPEEEAFFRQGKVVALSATVGTLDETTRGALRDQVLVPIADLFDAMAGQTARVERERLFGPDRWDWEDGWKMRVAKLAVGADPKDAKARQTWQEECYAWFEDPYRVVELGGTERVAVERLRVTGPQEAIVDLALRAPGGGVKDRFRFYARRYGSGWRLTLWAHGPEAERLQAADSASPSSGATPKVPGAAPVTAAGDASKPPVEAATTDDAPATEDAAAPANDGLSDEDRAALAPIPLATHLGSQKEIQPLLETCRKDADWDLPEREREFRKFPEPVRDWALVNELIRVHADPLDAGARKHAECISNLLRMLHETRLREAQATRDQYLFGKMTENRSAAELRAVIRFWRGLLFPG